ncbi:MAG: nucleotidyltransferase family protein [Saprospiraceae bacterium]
MVTQSAAIEIAQQYLSAVRALGVPVQKAYLFGSFAQDRQHEWSDIDLALIAEGFTGSVVVDKKPFRKLHLQPHFMAVEAHTFPTSLLESGHHPFLEEIKRTGIEIN